MCFTVSAASLPSQSVHASPLRARVPSSGGANAFLLLDVPLAQGLAVAQRRAAKGGTQEGQPMGLGAANRGPGSTEGDQAGDTQGGAAGTELCPVCTDSLEHDLAMLPCGHVLCCKCESLPSRPIGTSCSGSCSHLLAPVPEACDPSRATPHV